MNIYEKLQSCKSELQGMNLPKTGKNKFAGYDYWELSDFLPTVISLFKNNGICSICSFTSDVATLTLINIEKPEETIVVTSPMAAADLKGCHAIQNMGAVETYQRRYLYMAALDISEPDALDATQNAPKPQNKAPESSKYIDKVDQATLQAEILHVGGSVGTWITYLAEKFPKNPPKSIDTITPQQYEWSMNSLEKQPSKEVTA